MAWPTTRRMKRCAGACSTFLKPVKWSRCSLAGPQGRRAVVAYMRCALTETGYQSRLAGCLECQAAAPGGFGRFFRDPSRRNTKNSTAGSDRRILTGPSRNSEPGNGGGSRYIFGVSKPPEGALSHPQFAEASRWHGRRRAAGFIPAAGHADEPRGSLRGKRDLARISRIFHHF